MPAKVISDRYIINMIWCWIEVHYLLDLMLNRGTLFTWFDAEQRYIIYMIWCWTEVYIINMIWCWPEEQNKHRNYHLLLDRRRGRITVRLRGWSRWTHPNPSQPGGRIFVHGGHDMQWSSLMCRAYRRRIKTDAKAMVVACVWGKNLFKSLPR